jgi:MFS family permease
MVVKPIVSRRVRLPLVALVGAEGISWGGNALARVAIPWFVLEAGGSAAQTGVVVGVEMLPVVLGSVFGGVLVDRLGHRFGSVLSDVVSGTTVALIQLLHALGVLSLPVLMALVFAGALLDSAGIAARKALLPDVAARAGVTLERANAVHATTLRSAILVGPALGGALIPVVGVGTVLVLDAATFALSAVMIGRLVPGPRVRTARQRADYRTDLVEGLRFVGSDQGLRALIVAPTLLAVFVSPVFFAVLPAHLNSAGSALGLGLVYSAYGGGAALGAVGYAWLDRQLGRRRLFLLATAGQTAGVAILAMLPPRPLLLAGALLVGVAYGPIGPLIGVVVAECTPAALRARVFGAVAAPVALAAPLGVLLGGAVLTALPVAGVLAAAAVGCGAVTLAQLRWPAVPDAPAQRHPPGFEPHRQPVA